MPSMRRLPRRSELLLASLLLAAELLGATAEARAGEYAVLVNADNPIAGGEKARAAIGRLFLKRKSEWPNGSRASPFARPADSAAHRAFVVSVLGTSQNQLADWWARLKQTRGETPPRAVGSARFLLRAIGRREGAFGYAAKSELDGLPDNVKILFEFDG